MQSVLFVCLGNICRSPLAEAAMRLATEELGLALTIDSAGTAGYHIGRAPDPRAQEVARRLGGVDISNYRARQATQQDFANFDLICALDHNNFADLTRLASGVDGNARLTLLLDHLPGREGQEVADPYYGDMTDFELCWGEVRAAAKALALQLS